MIGDVYTMKAMYHRYYVRVEGASPSGKTLRVVECNAKGNRRHRSKVQSVRLTTFLAAYALHRPVCEQSFTWSGQ